MVFEYDAYIMIGSVEGIRATLSGLREKTSKRG